MLKLIVNADDFGLSEKTNEGIRQAHLHGILTSASLMANGEAFDHAVSVCREVPSLDVGAHLTLIEERPLLDLNRVPSLIDERGHFLRHATVFTRRYFQRRFSLLEIRAELEAQIQKITGAGIQISHLDSHQHIHVLPEILKIAVELAGKYRVPFVRRPREKIATYMYRGRGACSRIAQLLVLRAFCRAKVARKMSHPDYFAGFFHGGKVNRTNLREIIRHLPDQGSCELMCHPGQADPATRYPHWGYRPQDELDALMDPSIADVIREQMIKLATFRDLASDLPPSIHR